MCINELPYIHRRRKENLLLTGLLFGAKKLQPSLFVKNICDHLDTLRNVVDFDLTNGQDTVTVCGEVFFGTCDLPAKAFFLNMTQYNSEHGFQKCLSCTEPVA